MNSREQPSPAYRQWPVKGRWLLLLLVAVLAACGAWPGSAPPGWESSLPSAGASTGPPQAIGPTRICNDSIDSQPPPITCTEAIGQVLVELGPDAPFVRAASYELGIPCPPNARCIAPPPGSAYVVVRLEDGRTGLVRLAVADGKVTVGQPEDPTFDLWPASGQAAPPVGRPDAGPGAPAEISTREPLPLCGEERNGVSDRLARACFLGAVLDGRPAELVRRSVDSPGEPVVVEVLRFTGRGPVLVYRIPSVPGAAWTRNDCAIGSAFDDEMIFVVDECLPTELT